MKVKIKDVYIPEDRQRTKVDPGKIAELAVSLATHGQLHAITVKPLDRVRFPDVPAHLQYELVAGYRRLMASHLNRSEEIEANLREDLNELQAKEIELDENLQREQLPWPDEVKAKKNLLEVRQRLYGDSIRDVADHLGEAKSQTWEDVKLAKAIEENPDLLKSKNKTQAQNKLRLIARREALMEQAAERLQAGTLTGVAANVAGKVKLGDWRNVTREWTSQIIDCVITDPPYGIDLDEGETKKGNNHPTIYDDGTYDVLDMVDQVAKEAFRLLRDDTHAYFFFDIKQHGRVLKILQDAGFAVDPIPLVWVKPGPGQVNHPDSRWGSGYEACFFCRKGNRALLKQGQSNVLHHDPVPGKQKWHPVEKPTSLLRQLIETSTAPGEVVLDFFGGSGSTAHAAIELGRNFLTVEKDEGHHAAIIHRLTALVEGKPTSPPSSSSSPKSSKPKGADLPTTDDEDEELWEEAFSKRGK
jgi:ParB/RepB/Spo0J family partition protein